MADTTKTSKYAATNVVDYRSKTANMYGCEPCPKCGSKYRWPQRGTELILCEDCGFNEPAVYIEGQDVD